MHLNIFCEAARRHVVNVAEIGIKCFVVLQTPALLGDLLFCERVVSRDRLFRFDLLYFSELFEAGRGIEPACQADAQHKHHSPDPFATRLHLRKWPVVLERQGAC